MASQSSNDHLSASARKQLAALRGALESRLATLEEVLADPSRGESIAGLILDLSRIATEEAQAAASQACLATRAEADKEINELRTSAKAALDAAQTALRSAHASLEEERASSVELRRAADRAQLNIQKQAEALAAREGLEASLQSARGQLEAEIDRQKTIAADFQRKSTEAQQQLAAERHASADWQSQLEAERASSAGLRGAAERAEARMAALEHDQKETRAAQKALIANHDRERQAAAVIERTYADAQSQLAAARGSLSDVQSQLERERTSLADTQSQLEAERAAAADLRRVAQRANDLEAARGRETSHDQAAHEELSSELATERETAARLQKVIAQSQQALTEAQAEIEAARKSNAELRQTADYTDQQLTSARSSEVQALAHHDQLTAELERERAEAAKVLADLTTERDTIARELQAARQWTDERRAADAEFAVPNAPGATVAGAPAAGGAPASSRGSDDWEAVRLADRWVFREALSVQVNGNPGKLCDLSVTGCQILSHSALKPNHVVKVLLPSKQSPVTCTGKIVWTRLEPPTAGRPLGYRAGVRFTKPDEPAIEAFAARHST